MAIVLASAVLSVHAQSVAGIWQGKMQTASGFRIVFRFESANDGALRGVLYQPDQSVEGIVLSNVTFGDGELSVTQMAMDLSYRGKLSEHGEGIDGTLTRAGKTYALSLARATPETMWKHDAPTAAAAMVSSPNMAFKVATIKPSRPGTERSIRTRTRIFSTTGTTLENLVAFAWQLRAPRIDGLPEWAKTEKFDISAEPNAEGQPSEDQDREMLKKLLAERFGMKFHMGSREFPVYALGVEKTHTRMAASEPEFWRGSIYVKEIPGGDTQVQFVGQSMAMFADTIMNFIRERQIVDDSGLAGHFDFTLSVDTGDLKSGTEEVRGEAVRRAAKAAGFTLTPRRMPLSIVVMDAVEKPTPD